MRPSRGTQPGSRSSPAARTARSSRSSGSTTSTWVRVTRTRPGTASDETVIPRACNNHATKAPTASPQRRSAGGCRFLVSPDQADGGAEPGRLGPPDLVDQTGRARDVGHDEAALGVLDHQPAAAPVGRVARGDATPTGSATDRAAAGPGPGRARPPVGCPGAGRRARPARPRRDRRRSPRTGTRADGDRGGRPGPSPGPGARPRSRRPARRRSWPGRGARPGRWRSRRPTRRDGRDDGPGRPPVRHRCAARDRSVAGRRGRHRPSASRPGRARPGRSRWPIRRDRGAAATSREPATIGRPVRSGPVGRAPSPSSASATGVRPGPVDRAGPGDRAPLPDHAATSLPKPGRRTAAGS